MKKIIVFIIPLFLIFQIVYPIYVKEKGFDAVPSGVEAILIIVYTIYFFYEELNRANTQHFYYNYKFWICLGIMFYLSGTFFFFIIGSNMPEHLRELWLITYIIEIIKNILIVVAILIYSKANKENSLEKKQPYLDFTL